MKIVVLGAGAMGQVAVRDLCRSECVKEVLVGDLNADHAGALSAQIKSGKLKTAMVNVQDHQSLSELLGGFEVVINCSPYIFNVSVMEAALTADCHYLDLGGLFHVTRTQMELDQRFRKKNLLSVIGMGAAPGMTNVMASAAADQMDTVDTIDIYAASIDLLKNNHPFLPPYALDTILDEYSLSPFIFDDGKFQEVEALSGQQVHEFPPPLGSASTFLTLHSEVATLPLAYKKKGIRRVTYRLGLPETFHSRCRFLVELGLAGRDELKIDGVKVKPRSILSALIEQHQIPHSDPDDCEVIRVDVSGTKDGRRILNRLETTVRAHKDWRISSGALDTGVPPSIVAQMIASSEIKARGVHAPETCVPSQRFFIELALRGIEINQRIQDLA